MKNYTRMNFFYNNDGTRNEFADMLGSCDMHCSYMILKSMHGNDIKNYEELFLNESTLLLSTDENNNLTNLHTIDSSYHRDLFSLVEHKQEKMHPVDVISGILKTGEIAIVDTIIEMLPFSIFHDMNFNENRTRNSHAFLVIGEDKKNFYYIDNPEMIAHNKNKTLRYNKEVGLLNKRLLYYTAKFYLMVFTCEFNYTELENWSKNATQILHDSVKNYSKESTQDEGTTTYYGKYALLKLIDLLKAGHLRLNSEAPTRDRNMIDYLGWKTWNIKGKRRLLKQYLLCKEIIEGTAKRDELLNTIDDCVSQWDILNGRLCKSYMKNEFVMGENYIENIERIIPLEDKIIGILKENFEKVLKNEDKVRNCSTSVIY